MGKAGWVAGRGAQPSWEYSEYMTYILSSPQCGQHSRRAEKLSHLRKPGRGLSTMPKENRHTGPHLAQLVGMALQARPVGVGVRTLWARSTAGWGPKGLENGRHDP